MKRRVKKLHDYKPEVDITRAHEFGFKKIGSNQYIYNGFTNHVYDEDFVAMTMANSPEAHSIKRKPKSSD